MTLSSMAQAKKLSVGVLSLDACEVRAMKFGHGEYMCPPTGPGLWFDSITNYVT
jgi:hypothetical protein